MPENCKHGMDQRFCSLCSRVLERAAPPNRAATRARAGSGVPTIAPQVADAARTVGTNKLRRPPLNVKCDKSGRLSIVENIGPGWRLAQKYWRFSKSDKIQRHGQICRVTLSLFPTEVNPFFHPSNKRPGFVDARSALPETMPGYSEPPEFADHSGTRGGVEYRVHGSDCRVSLDLFDDRGDFNQELGWKGEKEKPTFEFWCDLWAQPLLFTGAQRKEAAAKASKPTSTPVKKRAGSVVRVVRRFKLSEEESQAVSEAFERDLAQDKVFQYPVRLELAIVVHPPPRNPAPIYREWWERTFPGVRIVSGGRPDSNRRRH